MKDYLSDLVRGAVSSDHGVSLAREYLQARILGCLQRWGAMLSLAFHGGTALRFLYSASRYSEDLDFALEREQAHYDLRRYLREIEGEFGAEGYAVKLNVNERRPVQSAAVRFEGLLHEVGLSPHRRQVLAVKIKVDTDPPQGAVLTTTVVRRHVMLQLQHHDRASLLAGTVHAILDRPFVKGRDLYDLLWYLSDPTWPQPNMTMLHNAMEQTGWTGPAVTEDNWRGLVRQRLEGVAWQAVAADVRPFIEPRGNPELLTRENLFRVL
jgi:predicted nucleotidyltransferase component of viral defense system